MFRLQKVPNENLFAVESHLIISRHVMQKRSVQWLLIKTNSTSSGSEQKRNLFYSQQKAKWSREFHQTTQP